jgi:tetratricopeptide (TPR) repeat protein
MLLAQALSLHQAGRRAEAEAAYRALLNAEPTNAPALHAYGVLRHQLGDSHEAVRLITRAIALAPGNAEFHFNLALACFRTGQLDEAAAAFSHAAHLKPNWPQPHYDLGNTHAAAGRFEGAARAYRAALRLRPDYVEAAVNLGNVLKSAGKIDQAITAYRRVLRDRPTLADVHNNLGTALQLQNDMVGAEAAFREAIRLRENFAEALGNLTALLGRTERFAEAAAMARAARAASPANAAFLEMHADALRGLGEHDAALAAYRDALAQEPGRHSARFGMAETLRLRRDAAGAEKLLRTLAAELPEFWQAHHDLANALRDLGRFAEAETEYRAALALRETPTGLKHLGAVLRDLQRLDEAHAVLQRAAAAQPKDADISYNIAITHLTAGRLREGFAQYDARLVKYRAAVPAGQPWRGENIRGRTILVECEQGLGDTIQFVRYIPALAARGARVVLRAPPPLLRLLTAFPGVAHLIARDAEPPEYDRHVPLMSLPDRLQTTDPMPIGIPYLFAGQASAATWRQKLAHLPGRRVGLAWAGNPGFAADRLRSIPPTALAKLAVPGAHFVSLQKDAAAIPALPLTDCTAELTDMADTAALIAALDLVICVDTGVAHLAGALGKPVWLLNRFDTCWRWLTGTDTSIWYPSIRLFRQTAPGDWSGPIAAVAAALTELA